MDHISNLNMRLGTVAFDDEMWLNGRIIKKKDYDKNNIPEPIIRVITTKQKVAEITPKKVEQQVEKQLTIF